MPLTKMSVNNLKNLVENLGLLELFDQSAGGKKSKNRGKHASMPKKGNKKNSPENVPEEELREKV